MQPPRHTRNAGARFALALQEEVLKRDFRELRSDLTEDFSDKFRTDVWWVDGVNAAGFRAGIYCSGIGATEGHGATVITAEDILQHAAGRRIAYWVTNDACPPSPGCAFPRQAPLPSESGIAFAEVPHFARRAKWDGGR